MAFLSLGNNVFSRSFKHNKIKTSVERRCCPSITSLICVGVCRLAKGQIVVAALSSTVSNEPKKIIASDDSSRFLNTFSQSANKS